MSVNNVSDSLIFKQTDTICFSSIAEVSNIMLQNKCYRGEN